MKVLGYIPQDGDAGPRLLRVVETIALEGQVETVETIEGLRNRLNQVPITRPFGLLLLITDKHQLMEILSFRRLLYDTRVILILPDTEKEMIRMGLQIYPRFISAIDSDFKDVAAVLKRISKNTGEDRKTAKIRSARKMMERNSETRTVV